MRSTNLPQPVACRLLDLDERVTALMAKADEADAELAHARAVLGNKTEVPREEYEQHREGFPVVLAHAQAARQRADSERGILQGIRSWVANLPHNTKLCLVPTPNGGDDLAALELRLKGLRAELGKLNNITLPADDTADRVQTYVDQLAAKSQLMLRGLGQGQQLTVLWPGGPDCNPRNGDGYSTIDGNALMLAALLQPDALVSAIVKAIADTQPMGREELKTRLAELPIEIDELSYTVAALRDRAGAPPDPGMSPWHILGVRTKEEEKVLAISA